MITANDILAPLLALERRIRRRMAFYGMHPYRIMRQDLGRLNLQAVNEGSPRIPATLAIEKTNGAQGIKEVCRPGELVLVGFQRGSPGAPYVAAYLPAPLLQTTPSTPVELQLDAEDVVRVGPSAASVALGNSPTRGIAREADSVAVPLPPAMFVGTIGGVAATGMVIWSPGQVIGNITTFSAKVKSE
jgi:hypothetical protein